MSNARNNLFAVASLWMATTGCVKFKAVSATAELGQGLGSHADSVRRLDENCRLLGSARLGDRCPTETRKWGLALEMVADYARQLGRLANPDDASVEGELATSLDAARRARWSQLSSDADATVAGVASKIAAFLSREVRRGSLQSTIREVHPSLDKLLGLLLAHLRIEREHLSILRCQVACSAGAPMSVDECPDTPPSTCGKPADAALLYPLVALSFDLMRESTQLDDTRTALEAFRAAHQRLYENVPHLSDAALYTQVLNDVTSIYKRASGAK